MTIEPVDIIVPTWNNFQQLTAMVASIDRFSPYYPVRFVIVNNGEKEMGDHPFFDRPNVTMVNNGENLGWEGGLIEGLKHSASEFVMFCNDDVVLPECSKHWITDLLQVMRDPDVGAVGPSSNVVMGVQNVFYLRPSMNVEARYEVPYLVGYCMLLRRSALDAAGGVDDSLPGGDDIDLSIRLRKAGYCLVCDSSVFLYHHGFSTGNRIHGDQTVSNGWNSKEMSENINMALVKKHGLRTFHDTIYGSTAWVEGSKADAEGDLIRSYVEGGKVVELGCGATKTVPHAVGVDREPKGTPIVLLAGAVSVADVAADVEGELPFKDGEFDTLIARHILEHCQDTVKTLTEWGRVVRSGGWVIIAVPDQGINQTIPMNPEHVHSFTKDSLANLMSTIGFRPEHLTDSTNGVSFIGVFEKK